MNLDNLKFFLKENNINELLKADDQSADRKQLKFEDLYFRNNYFIPNYIVCYGAYKSSSCGSIGGGSAFSIGNLYKNKCLNLPEIIINLLASYSNIQHILAFNLISQLDPNIEYN